MTNPDRPRQVAISTQKTPHDSSSSRFPGSDCLGNSFIRISERDLAEIFDEQLHECPGNVRGPLFVAYGKILKVSETGGIGVSTRLSEEYPRRRRGDTCQAGETIIPDHGIQSHTPGLHRTQDRLSPRPQIVEILTPPTKRSNTTSQEVPLRLDQQDDRNHEDPAYVRNMLVLADAQSSDSETPSSRGSATLPHQSPNSHYSASPTTSQYSHSVPRSLGYMDSQYARSAPGTAHYPHHLRGQLSTPARRNHHLRGQWSEPPSAAPSGDSGRIRRSIPAWLERAGN